MNGVTLPKQIDPFRMAKKKEVISGSLPLKSFKRLSDLLLDSQGDVFVEMSFDIDERHYTKIYGRIDSDLPMRCERCMKPMIFPVHQDFCLSPVQNESEIANLPNIYEAIFVREGKISVLELVEEELLLSLPFVVKHEHEDCSHNVN